MSFAWIFAIVVGGIIIFLTIYAATNFIRSGQYEVNTKTTQQLINILNPLQTSLESGRIENIDLTTETRIYVECNPDLGSFGENRIEISEKNSFGGKEWSDRGGNIGVDKNLYVFSEVPVEGNKIYLFSKPINFPFKVADSIILYSETYCFVSPPESVANELRGIGIGNSTNIEIKTSLSDCKKTRSVCFSSNAGCNISVVCNGFSCNEGYVEKFNKKMYFVEDSLYAAIFSSVDSYECNMNRVMKRTGYLAGIYADKARVVSIRGCDTGLESDLNTLKSISDRYEGSKDILSIKVKADEINDKNDNLGCQLF